MTEGAGPILSVEDLTIEARFGRARRTIVRSLNLTLAAGETIGIVGESGSGKSLTARALIGLLPRGVEAHGTVALRGRNLQELPERELRRVRGRDVALLLQDPFTMLNPLMRVGLQITEAMQGKRGRGAERQAEAVRRLAEVGIHDPGVAHRYPFQLSGGMRQRVAIAAALASDPEILIADEPSTALDVTTQKEILALLRAIQDARGMGLVLITHDLRVAFSLCRRIYVLYAGSILEVGPAAALEAEPLHPYTLGLLLSEPPLDRRVRQLSVVEGSVPAPDAVASRCTFVPRCAWAAPECSAGPPPLREVGRGRQSACIRIEDIRSQLLDTRRLGEQEAYVDGRSQSADVLVTVDQLTKRFPGSSRGMRGEVLALSMVSLEIAPGESVGLVGESGSGKTTLARCLVGLESPSSGRIVIDGIDATDRRHLSSAQRRLLAGRVQMVFQDPYSSLNPARTVGATLGEALAVGPPGHGGIPTLLELVGLPATYASRKPVSLSGGERQRVAIARALALQPEMLICDEPVSALDVSVQAQILNLFKSLREERGIAYLFVTHDLAVVRQVVDRVVVLYQGRVVESGPVDRVLDSPSHAYTISLIESVPRSDASWLAEG
jgi:peptide/nickel transport system ATP-binding protein